MVVTYFCRDMSFVASMCVFGLVLMLTLRILGRYCADFCTKKCSVEALDCNSVQEANVWEEYIFRETLIGAKNASRFHNQPVGEHQEVGGDNGGKAAEDPGMRRSS